MLITLLIILFALTAGFAIREFIVLKTMQKARKDFEKSLKKAFSVKL